MILQMIYRFASNIRRHLAVILLLASFCNVMAQIPSRPEPPRLVNDLAGIFSIQQRESLETRLVSFNDTTSNQIVVITVSDLGGYDKAEFATELGIKWGVGTKEHSNGVIILIKPKTERSGGEVFIAVGYGLEGAVPDAISKRVIEEWMIPYFKENDYYGGVDAALNVLLPLISGEISELPEDNGGIAAIAVIFLLIVLVVIILAIVDKKKGGHIGGGKSIGGIGGFSNPGRFSGGSFGGSSRGGFGDFGGGSFGGGGAGGRW